MPLEFLGRGKMRPRRPRLANNYGMKAARYADAGCLGDQAQADLPAAGQLHIDLRKKLGVEECSVLHAMTTVDSEPHAQGVEAVFGAWMPGPGEHQRIDHAVHADGRSAAALELVVEEAEIETGIMRYQRRILDEVEELLGFLRKARLIRQEQVGKPVYFLRLERHVAFGIEIGVEMPASLDAIKNFDAADLNHPVAACRIQARGLSVENDFPHNANLSTDGEFETSDDFTDLSFSCG